MYSFAMVQTSDQDLEDTSKDKTKKQIHNDDIEDNAESPE